MTGKKVIVIGGGAAGIFAAVNIAMQNPAFVVTVLEKSSKILAKVKVSGGGRCNVTNVLTDPVELARNYPRGNRELKKAFFEFSSVDTIKWFNARGVKLNAEADGRMFPESNSSQTIIDCLVNACEEFNVSIRYNTGIRKIVKEKKSFSLLTDAGNRINCDLVVIATGGNPRAEAYQWLRDLGHSIEHPVPSLFTFNFPDSEVTSLQGLAVKNCQVKIAGTKLLWTGPLLITHWGFSGPAILKLSAFGARLLYDKNYQYTVLINWLNGEKEQDVKKQLEDFKLRFPLKNVSANCPFDIPKRLWEYLLKKSGLPHGFKWVNVKGKLFNKLASNLVNDEYQGRGKTTFKEEFVTCGGINLSEVDFETMESKTCKGLYFCGEVLDIDGITGGFNFQAAWTTAWIAAKAIAGKNPITNPST